MFLGALVDAGAPLDLMRETVAALRLPEMVNLSVSEVHKGALRASSLSVEAPHSHHHRHWGDIREMLEAAPLSARTRDGALAIFKVVAEAEGRVHGVPVDEVHFHEVGALDSIADIVCAAAGLEALGIERLYASALPYGGGTVKTEHGALPLPAPATLEILSRAQAPLVPAPEGARVELVTPTGAAILAALATFDRPEMRLEQVGVGAGKKDLPWPNVLRLWVGHSDPANDPPHVLLETNIDDMNPQLYAPLMARLFSEGALDVFFTPITMKKIRPAVMVSIIARKPDEARLAHLLLRETTTLGVRTQPLSRYEAGREFHTVDTAYGPLPVKVKLLDGRRVQAAPEFDACLAAAETHGVAVMEVYQAGLAAGRGLVETETPSADPFINPQHPH